MKYCNASSQSDLNWDVKPDPEQVYRLDFSWTSFDPRDDLTFNRDYLAVEAFAKTFPSAKRVIMGHLDGDFASMVQIGDILEREWKESELLLEIFCAQLVSDYLHRLASALPEDAIPTILVTPGKRGDRALLVLMFSRRRFEHFEIQFQEELLPIQGMVETVISLPQDKRFDQGFFNQLLSEYDAVKCIPEELLNEHWDGASTILYDSLTIGELGERMLLGFQAAGGEIKKVR